ncbi:MAG: bifunctional aspartate kinase/homoserine dehydrogenase I, partial [Bacteroidetes bacterium]
MKVLKFGGSSVANAERIHNVARICLSYIERGERFAVVVSAMSGITDMLIKMSRLAAAGSDDYKPMLDAYSDKHRAVADELIKDHHRRPEILNEIIEGQKELGNLLHGLSLTRDLTPRTLDYIQSFGERSNAFIISHVMQTFGIDSIYVNARKLIVTDESYGSAKIYKDETYANIRRHFDENPDKLSVITGFIASTREGITTTLGRGGSDYTASIFGAALDVEEIEIWTDVDGVMTADPRRVRQAYPVASMSYEEALEISHFGAKVIYPPTILPALEKKIPVRIKNTFNPSAEGTLISDNPDPWPNMVKGITSVSQVALVAFEGSGLFGASSMAARLFACLASKNINALLITQGSSQHSISLAIPPSDAATTVAAIGEEFALEMKAGLIDPVHVDLDCSIIAIIGDNMKSRPGISAKFFTALGKNGVNVIVTAQGSSERNISVVIKREDETKALNAVHDVFFLSNYYTVNLFIVGTGLIGSTLLNQIRQQAEFLRRNQYVELRVIALANTRRMLFKHEGINLEDWKEQLAGEGEPTDLKAFLRRMKELNLQNAVFVDNTADNSIHHLYPEILESSISISTPNKVAVSSEYEQYCKLKNLADERSVKFFYETNVGAGLPVLTTLNDLINSGDHILRIEGVLSGSLSYIFNNFHEGVRFSDVVKQARALGYTEPDPRLDLSGRDVARKLLILARESRLKMEMEDIQVENILPQSCLDAADADQFMAELEKYDDLFEARRADAAAAGKTLRFIATLDGDKAVVSLQAVEPGNPFLALSGSENMIVFTSERYKERPLVIKGPGAGAEV